MTTHPDRLDSLPPLRQVIAQHDLSAKKSLGQNFLLDLNLTRRIARSGGPLEGCHVIEIGPGPGGLTRAILAEGAARLTVVERDHRVIPALQAIAAASDRPLVIVEGDAMAIDQAELASGPEPVRVIANLPYNIATPLLAGWLTCATWPSWWQSLTLMFQREVAERIVAGPGSKTYGRLSVLAGWRCTSRIIFDVPPQAFTPPPKVTSSIVRLEPLAGAADISSSALEAVTAAAFGQRRKMLRSSLKSIWVKPEPVLEAHGINPALRAENLSVAEFVTLARIYMEDRGPAG